MPRRDDIGAGVRDMAAILVAAAPIGLLWGTLAAGKGFSALEAWLMSVFVFAGASQFVAIELWQTPVDVFAVALAVFIVNLRHILMAASLSRQVGAVKPALIPLMAYVLVDEAWALSERRALSQKFSLAYYLTCGFGMWITWTTSTALGAWLGRSFGDPAALGIDFAFSAMFIGIIAGFWKGPKTAAVLAVAGGVAALAKLTVPGAWYILAGGLSGVVMAAALYREGDNDVA